MDKWVLKQGLRGGFPLPFAAVFPANAVDRLASKQNQIRNTLKESIEKADVASIRP